MNAAPSSTDFLLHDIPSVIDRLAEGSEPAAMPSGYDEGSRVLIGMGLLVTDRRTSRKPRPEAL